MTGEPEPPHSISKASPKPSQSFFNQFKVIGKFASEDARHPGVALLINSNPLFVCGERIRSDTVPQFVAIWTASLDDPSWFKQQMDEWMCGHQMRTLGTK